MPVLSHFERRPRGQNPARPVLSHSKRQPQPTRFLCTRPSVVRHGAPRAHARVGSVHSLRCARNGTTSGSVCSPSLRTFAKIGARSMVNLVNFAERNDFGGAAL